MAISRYFISGFDCNIKPIWWKGSHLSAEIWRNKPIYGPKVGKPLPKIPKPLPFQRPQRTSEQLFLHSCPECDMPKCQSCGPHDPESCGALSRARQGISSAKQISSRFHSMRHIHTDGRVLTRRRPNPCFQQLTFGASNVVSTHGHYLSLSNYQMSDYKMGPVDKCHPHDIFGGESIMDTWHFFTHHNPYIRLYMHNHTQTWEKSEAEAGLILWSTKYLQ